MNSSPAFVIFNATGSLVGAHTHMPYWNMTMALTQHIDDIILADPIELVSRFVARHDWLLRRQARNAISAEIPGKWSDYQLLATWQDSEQTMHVLEIKNKIIRIV